MNWQPIATAPVERWDSHRYVLIYCVPKHNEAKTPLCAVAVHKISISGYPYWAVSSGDVIDESHYEPTHWMPLPPMPIAKSGGAA